MSTATRRIKELEKALAERDRIIAGLVEYAERAESLGCAFAMEVANRLGTGFMLPTPSSRLRSLEESLQEARAEAGEAGRIFGGR